MTLAVTAIPIFSDNYAWLLEDRETGHAAAIDPADAAAVEAVLTARTLRLGLVLLTHHHDDHVGAAAVLSERWAATLIGARADTHRLPALDRAVMGGEEIVFGKHTIQVIDTPGHTLGHISYFVPDVPALFAGDTLFSLGCGRLFEGTAEQMFASLRRFDALPDNTLLCCGHEYTEGNARFAQSIDPENIALRHRVEIVQVLRAEGKSTVPVELATERATNPFLRAASVKAFADLRHRKDLA